MVSVKSYHTSNMKRFLLKVILFFSLFTYFYSIQFNFFPISTLRILQIIGFAFFFYHVMKKGLNRVILLFFLYGILFFFIGFLSTSIFNNANEYEVAMRGIHIFLLVFAAYFIVLLMRKIFYEFSLYTIVEWMLLVTIVQGVCSLIFFFSPIIYDKYNQFVVNDSNIPLDIVGSYRLMSVGGVRFANAAAHYGVVMWGGILLYVQKRTILYKYKILFYLITTLFCVVGIMSGRTFFIVLSLTFPYVYYMSEHRSIFNTLKQMFFLFFPTLVLCTILFIYLMRDNEMMVQWAFELFINLVDNGQMESSSTTGMVENMYVFPSLLKTWFIGDGRITDGDLFYMHTDVGYIRSLFYWGGIGTLIYYFSQYKFYRILQKRAADNSIQNYLFMILIFFYVFSLKEFWRIESYFILFLLAIVDCSNDFSQKVNK